MNPFEKILRSWVCDEMRLQQRKLKELERANQFTNITGYKELLEMRRELVNICIKAVAALPEIKM